MSHKNRHETHKSDTRYKKAMAIGVTALALAGMTGKGREVIANAWNPDKQPVKIMKFENVGPKGATVFEQIGDKPKPKVEIGDAMVATKYSPVTPSSVLRRSSFLTKTLGKWPTK
jgi:hypothetical protein